MNNLLLGISCSTTTCCQLTRMNSSQLLETVVLRAFLKKASSKYKESITIYALRRAQGNFWVVRTWAVFVAVAGRDSWYYSQRTYSKLWYSQWPERIGTSRSVRNPVISWTFVVGWADRTMVAVRPYPHLNLLKPCTVSYGEVPSRKFQPVISRVRIRSVLLEHLLLY